MKKNLIILHLLFVSILIAQQDPLTLSVEQAVELAVKNNSDLNKSRIDQQIISAQITEIKGCELPQVNGNRRFTDKFLLAAQKLTNEFFSGEPSI